MQRIVQLFCTVTVAVQELIQQNFQFMKLVKLLLTFSTTHCRLKAYCAICVRSSNFRHQASPRVSTSESTQRREVELWARNVQEFCLNADLRFTFNDLLLAVKLRHGTDGFTSLPNGTRADEFFALKIRRLRPGANPRIWVPKDNTLPLDHRSR